MIEVKNLTKKFDKFTAIQNISLKIGEGSIYGLAGYNGAGKTTLIKTIAGIYKPDEGKALLDGENSYDSNVARERLFFVPDDIFFLPGATMDSMAKFYRGYYPHFSKIVFERISKLFDLDTKKRIRGFSKGMQRQAEIALALASRPKNMLMDECFDGLDPAKRILAKKLFIEYAAESECSMFISSHNLSELAELCDHVGLINGKTLVLDSDIYDIGRDYRKYQVVFTSDTDKNSLATALSEVCAFKRLELEGRAAAFTAKGSVADIRARLAAFRPANCEEFPLTLEEVFIYEMEDEKHDVTKIFE